MSTTNDSLFTARRRVMLCALVGGAAGLVFALLVPWQLAVLIGWDSMAVVLLVWIWAEIWPADAAATQRWSGPEDSSHAAALVVMTTASVVSLAGMAMGLIKARQSTQPLEAVLTVVAVLTVALSWCVVHTMYTLRYAHLYYRDPVGGISFHTDQPPDYHDFAYLAFTVGMAFAVSDTDLTGRQIRRTCTRHALVSYLFGAVIVGLTINVMAGFVR